MQQVNRVGIGKAVKVENEWNDKLEMESKNVANNVIDRISNKIRRK